MQLRFAKSGSVSPARSIHRGLLLLTPALVMLLTACAAQKPFQFHANSITKISYDPKNCTELPNGKFRCKNVIFVVSAVEPAPASNAEPVQEARK